MNLNINGRDYTWPKQPTIVICVDGCEPAYIDEAIKAGVMPFMQKMLVHGSDLRANCVIPSFTNPNNISIVTGVPPSVHGICGNYFLDPENGEAVMMNDPKLLRSGTILAAFAKAGARIAVVTAKDKLRALLGHELPMESGRVVCFSSEKADQVTRETNGLDEALEFVGHPLPSVYSAELSEFVLAAGVKLLESDSWELMYLSTTDYIQHKNAPGTPLANSFYAMMDGYLAKLDALGATIAITADHGMKPKHDDLGRPNVIYLQSLLDSWLGEGSTRVILPITDPYVIHHGALGGFAVIHLSDEHLMDDIIERLGKVAGISEVLPRKIACSKFELPEDREGDLIIVSDSNFVLGIRPEDHDLSQLHDPLRSHGGTSEQIVPMLLNRRCDSASLGRSLRNFDAYYLALNPISE
jgi:phosphonoacetate hydrolase